MTIRKEREIKLLSIGYYFNETNVENCLTQENHRFEIFVTKRSQKRNTIMLFYHLVFFFFSTITIKNEFLTFHQFNSDNSL